MFLLVALALLASGWVGAHLLFAERSALERVWLSCLLANAAPIGVVSLLSTFGLVGRVPFLVLVFAASVIVITRVSPRERAAMRVDVDIALDVLRAPGTRLTSALLIALLAVGASLVATHSLVPWAWDALGYHLPQSDIALSFGAFGAAPSGVVYVDAYPHLGATYFTAFRLALGGDTWVESAQLPFAMLAVLSIAVMARRHGVPTRRALALSLLFLAIPTVTLQLSANYVDVIFAALVLSSFVLVTGPIALPTCLLAGLVLGLVLGTKPSGPLYVLLALMVLAWRARQVKRLGEAGLALGVALCVGGWKYIENAATHGNPIWPVQLDVGLFVLPGQATMRELAIVGLREPMRSASAVGRVLMSWSTPFPNYAVYDMRVGGLGALFTLGLLPVSLAASVAVARDASMRERLAPLMWIAIPITFATLVTPALYWGRYTLAFAGVLIVLVALSAQSVPTGVRRGIDTWLLALALLSCWSAMPGFTAGGPSLLSLAARPGEASFGIDDNEAMWQGARSLVRPGEAFAYDASFGLPGRLFPAHQQARVVFLGEPASLQAAIDELHEVHARAVVLADGPHSLAEEARSHPETFRDLGLCGYDPCAVFAVLPGESQ